MPTLPEQLADLASLTEARRPVQGPSKDEWFRNTYLIAGQRGGRKGELWGFKKMLDYAMKYIQQDRRAAPIMLNVAVKDGTLTRKEMRAVASKLLADKKFMERGLVPQYAASMVAERLYSMYLSGKLGKRNKHLS